MSIYLRLFTLLAALVPLSIASANADDLEWYHVEVIVFEQRETGGRDAERWSAEAADPVAARAQPLAAATSQWQPFSALPRDQLRLRAHYDRLAASDEYQPLLHLAWRQHGLSAEDSIAVPIPNDWKPREIDLFSSFDDLTVVETPPLYGYLRVYRERFLHLVTDLRYRRPTSLDAENRYPYLEGAEPIFVMQDSRRMRSGELHYLDHPVLGILVRITPVEPEDDSGS